MTRDFGKEGIFVGTFVVALILLAVIGAAAASLIRGKKNGKCSCGGDCGACPGCAAGRGGEE